MSLRDLESRKDEKMEPREPDRLYVCPMHAGERSNEPGKCTICWMPLELVRVFDLTSTPWYYCPEHPEPQYVEPGKCPRCGKELRLSDG